MSDRPRRPTVNSTRVAAMLRAVQPIRERLDGTKRGTDGHLFKFSVSERRDAKSIVEFVDQLAAWHASRKAK